MGIKILHAAQSRTPLAGIIRQMQDEQNAARDIDIAWDTRLFCPAGTEGSICVQDSSKNGWWESKRNFYKWLTASAGEYDVLLLRYSRCDPFQARFVRQSEVPVYTVHHTLELHELGVKQSLKNKCRQWVEELAGPRTLKHVSGVVGVTREIADYSRQRSGRNDLQLFTYPNGAIYDEHSVVHKKITSEVPELLLVASNYAAWIGLDLLIESVTQSSGKFVIHIVGGTSEEQERSLSEDARFVVHGFLDHEGIRALIARSSLGIGSLALFRNNMTEGNTLKVKEYLRAGLPVYAGYQDVFDDAFPYYRKGPVDVDAMLEFCKMHKDTKPEDISAMARPFIEKQTLLKSIYDQLCQHIEGRKAV